MDKKQNADLQSAIMQKIDLSRQMSEEEVREIIDEQIKQESKKHCLEVTAREQLRRDIFYSIRQLGILQELKACYLADYSRMQPRGKRGLAYCRRQAG